MSCCLEDLVGGGQLHKHPLFLVELAMQLICTSILTAEPAQILEKAKSVDVTEKDPVTLECVVAGTPELKVKWLKDGKQIVPSRYFSMSFENNVASFRIQSVMKQDSGQYTFKVENDFGSSSCDADIRVLGVYLGPSWFPLSLLPLSLVNKWQHINGCVLLFALDRSRYPSIFHQKINQNG